MKLIREQLTEPSELKGKLNQIFPGATPEIEISPDALKTLPTKQKAELAEILHYSYLIHRPLPPITDGIKAMFFEALLEDQRGKILKIYNIKQQPGKTIYDVLEIKDIADISMVYGRKEYYGAIDKECRKRQFSSSARFAASGVPIEPIFTFFDSSRNGKQSSVTKRVCKNTAFLHLCSGKILHFMVDDIADPFATEAGKVAGITTSELKFISKILPVFREKLIFFWHQDGSPALPPWEDIKHQYHEAWKKFITEKQSQRKHTYLLQPTPPGMSLNTYVQQVLQWWPNRKDRGFVFQQSAISVPAEEVVSTPAAFPSSTAPIVITPASTKQQGVAEEKKPASLPQQLVAYLASKSGLVKAAAPSLEMQMSLMFSKKQQIKNNLLNILPEEKVRLMLDVLDKFENLISQNMLEDAQKCFNALIYTLEEQVVKGAFETLTKEGKINVVFAFKQAKDLKSNSDSLDVILNMLQKTEKLTRILSGFLPKEGSYGLKYSTLS